LGFGKANNLGATYASGKYLFFLNSDTILLNNAVFFFWNFLENSFDKKIVAVGGNLFTEDLNENFSYSKFFPSLLAIILYRSRLFKLLNNDIFNRTKLPKQVSIIIGADLFIKKSSFDEVAGFDPKIFMYIEDGDLQYQLFKLGYKVYNLPVAEIIHLQGASSTTGEKLLMEVKSYYYYFNKNHNNLISISYLFIEISFAFICYIFFYLKGKRIKSQMYYKLLKFTFNELLVN
jgi:GT2 family glycosyltransferase